MPAIFRELWSDRHCLGGQTDTGKALLVEGAAKPFVCSFCTVTEHLLCTTQYVHTWCSHTPCLAPGLLSPHTETRPCPWVPPHARTSLGATVRSVSVVLRTRGPRVGGIKQGLSFRHCLVPTSVVSSRFTRG